MSYGHPNQENITQQEIDLYKASPERFKRPTDEQIVKAALLFGDGNLDDKGRLTDMVGLCLWVVDRLYENGDILIPSSKE